MFNRAVSNPVTDAARGSRFMLHAMMILLLVLCSALFFQLAVQLSQRLRTETFHQYRALAEEVVGRINDDLEKRVVTMVLERGDEGLRTVALKNDAMFLLKVTSSVDGLRVATRDQGKIGASEVLLANDARAFFSESVSRAFSDGNILKAQTVLTLFEGERLLLTAGVTDDVSAGVVIFRRELASPFENYRLIIKAPRIPLAKSGQDARALVGGLLLLLPAGFGLLYLLALRQVDLAEERSRFVSEVSHELRTPLTSIRLYSEMLRDGMVTDQQKQHEYASMVASEAERLSTLVADLLDLSRYARGLRKFELRKERVADLVELVGSRIGPMCSQRGFALELGSSIAENIQIVVDREAFLRIAINLVDNALRHGASAEKRIVVSLRCDRRQVFFEVRDFGPGYQRRWFRAPRPTSGGTGIGLALVKEAVERMGGKLTLSNAKPGALASVRFGVRRGAKRA